MEGLCGDNAQAVIPYCCLQPAFEVDQMWWIMHSLHCLFQRQYYLWQTSAFDSLPKDRWEKFYTFFPAQSSVRQTQLFLETLSCNPPYWRSKFFSFFNLSSFNPRSLRAWANPPMQLMKLLITLLSQDTWQRQSWEQREHGDQTQLHTLESELNWGIYECWEWSTLCYPPL